MKNSTMKKLNLLGIVCLGINLFLFAVPAWSCPTCLGPFSIIQIIKCFSSVLIYIALLFNTVIGVENSYIRIMFRVILFGAVLILSFWCAIYWGITAADEAWTMKVYFENACFYEIALNLSIGSLFLGYNYSLNKTTIESTSLYKANIFAIVLGLINFFSLVIFTIIKPNTIYSAYDSIFRYLKGFNCLFVYFVLLYNTFSKPTDMLLKKLIRTMGIAAFSYLYFVHFNSLASIQRWSMLDYFKKALPFEAIILGSILFLFIKYNKSATNEKKITILT